MSSGASTSHRCRVCGCDDVRLKRKGVDNNEVRPEDFRITDAGYGVTGDIYQCADCHFQFCPDLSNVLAMYQQMDDPQYEATREERALQARKILDSVNRHNPGMRLLDVGAGSGILVEEALARGYQAVGVEPSEDLVEIAAGRNLPVLPGVLGQQAFEQRFDVVTLVDVIEHVEDPAQLVREAVRVLDDSGLCLVISPDVNSLCARILGRRWWHYRIAHISYFSRQTLTRLLHDAGLQVVAIERPGWYFPANYLFDRCMQYLPKFMRFRAPAFLQGFTVPLNLFDSLLLTCRPLPRPDVPQS